MRRTQPSVRRLKVCGTRTGLVGISSRTAGTVRTTISTSTIPACIASSRRLGRSTSRTSSSLASIAFGGNTTSHQFNSWFMYPSRLPQWQQVQSSIYPALTSQLITDGQTHTRTRIICAEGDSITASNAKLLCKQSAGTTTGQGPCLRDQRIDTGGSGHPAHIDCVYCNSNPVGDGGHGRIANNVRADRSE
jgi:hypothetical protein